MGVKVTVRGSYKRTETFLNRMKRREQFRALAKYGPRGVAALRAATPVEDGDTRDGWYYQIVDRPGYYAIHWYNSNVVGGVPVAVLLQYGHATGNGGYVEGRDFINPALRPIFVEIANEMWKEVTR